MNEPDDNLTAPPQHFRHQVRLDDEKDRRVAEIAEIKAQMDRIRENSRHIWERLNTLKERLRDINADSRGEWGSGAE